MAIATVNMFYQGTSNGADSSTSTINSPTSNGILASVQSGFASQELNGFCLPVLDGAATTFTVNWIDGVQTLPFVPSLVQAFRVDPPAWNPSILSPLFTSIYPLNAVVLGSGHVQQVTSVSKGSQAQTAFVAPTWSTAGATVVDNLSFPITSVNNAVGALTTYNGTFVAGNPAPGSSVTITGFVTNPVNNGTFVVSSSTATTLVVQSSAGIAETHAATAVSTSGTGAQLSWKDLGAIAVGTVGVTSVTAITNLSALVTISAAGSNTNVATIALRILR